MNQDVLMKFGLTEDPKTGPALQKLAGSVRSSMQEVNRSISAVGDEALATVARIERAIGNLRTQSSRAPVGVSSQGPQSYSQYSSPTSPTRTFSSSYGDQLGRLGGLSSDTGAIKSRGVADAATYSTSFRESLTGISESDLGNLLGTSEQFERMGRERGEAASRGMRGALSGTEGLGGVGLQGPAPLSVPAPAKDDVKDQARDDAETYASSFGDTLSQLTGMTDDELSDLVSTDEAFERAGKKRGEAARKGIRDALTEQLGLDSKSAEELFGAKGGSGIQEQQQADAAAAQARATAIDSTITKLSSLDSESKKVGKSLNENFKGVAERIEGGASALGQFASGVGILTAGNKDFEAFVKTVLQIKGFADVGVGVVKAFTNIATGIATFGERQELVAQQQELATQKQELLTQATREYSAVVQAGEQETQEMTARLKEHSGALQQVAANAEKATQSTRELSSAQNTAARGRAGARGGRAGGIGSSVASVVGSEGIAATVGTGIAGLLANIGLDAIIEKAFSSFGKRAAAGAAGSAAASAAGGVAGTAAVGAGGAAAGAGGAVAGGSLAALATTAGAAAAALGAIGLVGYQLSETFRGTATKAGSLTDRIASLEVGFVDWVRDLLGSSKGGFDLVGGSEQARKADKALEQRRKMAAENEIQRATASQVQAININSQSQIFSRRIGDMDAMRGVNSQTGIDRLNSLVLQQANLGTSIAGEKQLADLLRGDKTTAGRAKLAEAEERIRQLQQQQSNVGADILGTKANGGVSAKDQLGEKNLTVQRELATVQKNIADLSADETKNAEALAAERQRAVQLGDQLVGIEQEQLSLIRAEADERKRANEEGIAAMTQRLSLAKQERMEAEGTLKSAAERFAQMNRADQNAAKRAMQIADRGGNLTDRQRGLLRGIGTSRAVASAENADRIEAEKRGFSSIFGQEERQKVAEATRQEQQLRVEIANKQQVQVQIELDQQKMAKEVASYLAPMIAKNQKELQASIQAETQKQLAALMKQANADNAKARATREAS